MYCYCGTRNYNFLFDAGNYHVVQCIFCRQVRVLTPLNIRRKNLYRKEDVSIYIQKEEMFRRIFREVIDFIKQYRSSGVLVDIGAGVGLLVDEGRRAGFNAQGLEPSRAGVAAGKRFFHVSLLNKKFSKKSIKKPVDIIVLNHVLEHLPNPSSVIHVIANLLERDGLLVIGVPNFGSIMSILKKSNWQSLIPDQHRWQFDQRTLDQLVFPFGFKKIGIKMENHSRSMHPLWKQPIYWMLDNFSLLTGHGEAMLIVYKKV